MKEKIMPPLVLALISTVVCALLVFANDLTKDKIAVAQEEKISASLSETFGDAKYEDITPSVVGYGVNAVYEGDNNKTIYEITVSGYAKDGLHILVGFDDETESICGIGFLDIAETPGLGTKVKEEKSFTEQFIGLTQADTEHYELTKFEPVTGATYSSNGMKNAIEIALMEYKTFRD